MVSTTLVVTKIDHAARQTLSWPHQAPLGSVSLCRIQMAMFALNGFFGDLD
jgi:hypothetical protein